MIVVEVGGGTEDGDPRPRSSARAAFSSLHRRLSFRGRATGGGKKSVIWEQFAETRLAGQGYVG